MLLEEYATEGNGEIELLIIIVLHIGYDDILKFFLCCCYVLFWKMDIENNESIPIICGI